MPLSDRTRDGIDNWFNKPRPGDNMSWAQRILNWFARGMARGLVSFLEVLEPEAIADSRDLLAQVVANPNLPPAAKKLIGNASTGTAPIHIIFIILATILCIVPMILGLFDPLRRIMNYAQERVFKSGRFDWRDSITAWRRGYFDDERLQNYLQDHGFDEIDRDVAEKISRFYPGAADLVLWQAREVFEPDMVSKYGLRDELENLERSAFYKAGLDDEQIDNYWIAHWEHASYNQVVDMYRRGLITESDFREWFRVVEVPPFWRDNLIEISWNIPTRVDVRRFWDMGTITEERLREIYTAQGYHGKDLDDYVLWTKIYVAYPDLVARYKNGWLTLDEVRDELTRLGMDPDRAEELIQTKFKSDAAERTVAERDLTKTDIYKGVKVGRITRAQGLELLQDLGYDADEAEYLLDINIPEDEEDTAGKYRELTKSDIRGALIERLITPVQAITRLQKLRYTRADAELLISIYQAAIPAETVEETRELAKGDIGKGLKRGIINEEEALGMLTALNYSIEDAKYLIEVNKPTPEDEAAENTRRLSKADLKNLYLAGAMDRGTVMLRLEDLGYTSDDTVLLVDLYDIVAELKGAVKPKEAGKADIVSAVKKGLITSEEGYLMLIDIGFSPDASTFILQVHAEESPFSPVTFDEFKDRSAKWRRIAGMDKPAMTDDIKAAADELVRARIEVQTLESAVEAERRELVGFEDVPPAATEKLKQLEVALNRARAEVDRLQLVYNQKVTAWKYGG